MPLTKDQTGTSGKCKTSDLTLRLSRIEGQIRGINRMVENGVYCDDVLVQVIAVQSALYGVSKLILENHIRNRLSSMSDEVDEQLIHEMLKSIHRLQQIGSK